MRRRVRHALQCRDQLAFGARRPLSRADLNPNPGYAQGAAPDRAIAELQELAPSREDSGPDSVMATMIMLAERNT
jgi:hypothetical protein